MTVISGKKISGTTISAGLVLLGLLFVISVSSGKFTARTDVVPEFEASKTLNAEEFVSAESIEHRPALLNVWASWCLGCRTEHELLMRVADSEVISLYGLNYLDVREDAVRWLGFYGNPYMFSIYDQGGAIGQNMDIDVLPVTILIGQDGDILYRHTGPLNQSILDDEILPLLENK